MKAIITVCDDNGYNPEDIFLDIKPKRLNAPSESSEKAEFERGFRAGYLSATMKFSAFQTDVSVRVLNELDSFFKEKENG